MDALIGCDIAAAIRNCLEWQSRLMITKARLQVTEEPSLFFLAQDEGLLL